MHSTGKSRTPGQGHPPGVTTTLRVSARWRLEKWPEGAKRPRTDAVSRALKWAFPWRESLPAEVVEGGDDVPTTVTIPTMLSWWDFTKQHYPRIRRALLFIISLWRKLWH